jgi:GR25 family glycosyltransferase involved in LPS biosynthesis
MKFTHKVFHIDSDSERDWLVKSINIYLSKHSVEMQTPTVQISSDKDLRSFYTHNPDFNIDPNGYNLHGVQGWKYGELGIWASNYIAWKNFLKTDSDYLILMEDDIVFNQDFFLLLEKYLDELPEGWEFFSFFSPADQHDKYNASISWGENTSFIYQDWSCLCYVLSRKGAEKSLAMMNSKVSLPVDWFFYRQKEKFYGYSIKPDSPKGCTLASLESTFQEKHERKIINGIF